jgi:murein DD-endopeptidase MepM/ murein hydrolase activator NlpD
MPRFSDVWRRVPAPVAAVVIGVATITAVALAGCGGPPSAPRALSGHPAPATSASDSPSGEPSDGSSPSAPAASASPSGSGLRPAGSRFTYVFPVLGKVSYAHDHHDYPATDIIAPCGATAVSPVNGTVLEVNRVDTWDPKVNAGPTRGGLSVSILGEDGVRFYGSHFSSIKSGIDAGAKVTAGQQIAVVGKTGDASACHEHFGLWPVCARTGDWYNRRGLIWPWPYLDSWRAGTGRSPVNEIAAWQNSHGCPTKPLAP